MMGRPKIKYCRKHKRPLLAEGPCCEIGLHKRNNTGPYAFSLLKFSETPCPRCLELAQTGTIRAETVQRLPEGVGVAPSARDGSGKCCFDCASADSLMGRMSGLTFEMARIAVGNDRQEQYRLPGVPMGLAIDGLVRKSAPGDLENQHAWLERMHWFDIDEENI
jgi:hypothetical protein